MWENRLAVAAAWVAVLSFAVVASTIVTSVWQWARWDSGWVEAAGTWAGGIGTILAIVFAIRVHRNETCRIREREQRDAAAVAVAVQYEMSILGPDAKTCARLITNATSGDLPVLLGHELFSLSAPMTEKHLGQLGCLDFDTAHAIARAVCMMANARFLIRTFTANPLLLDPEGVDSLCVALTSVHDTALQAQHMLVLITGIEA